VRPELNAIAVRLVTLGAVRCATSCAIEIGICLRFFFRRLSVEKSPFTDTDHRPGRPNDSTRVDRERAPWR
jgi:hypothetical protein